MKMLKTMLIFLIITFSLNACDRDPINANKRSGSKEDFKNMPKFKSSVVKSSKDNKTNSEPAK